MRCKCFYFQAHVTIWFYWNCKLKPFPRRHELNVLVHASFIVWHLLSLCDLDWTPKISVWYFLIPLIAYLKKNTFNTFCVYYTSDLYFTPIFYFAFTVRLAVFVKYICYCGKHLRSWNWNLESGTLIRLRATAWKPKQPTEHNLPCQSYSSSIKL